MASEPRAEINPVATRLHEARMAAFLDQGRSSVDAAPSGELAGLIARTAEIYAQAVTDDTRIAYARRWHLFERWCALQHLDALAAAPETVMLYISDIVTDEGAALSTVRGWMAAINRVHREAGLTAPADDPAMGTFLRGLARAFPPQHHPMAMDALRIADLRLLCKYLEGLMESPVSERDASVFALHQMGVGDGEMSRLVWDDVTFASESVQVRLRSVRRDCKDRTVEASADDVHCSNIEALNTWSRACGLTSGPVFTPVEANGWHETRALTARAIFKIRRSRMESLGTPEVKATPAEVIHLLSGPPSEVLRDKSVLLLGFAGAFRRNEVTNLVWSDIRPTSGGLIVHLRRSKTDTSGRGRDVGIPTGQSELTCPVLAFTAWKDRREHQLGPAPKDGRVFTHLGRAGRITDAPLSPEGLTRLVQRRTHQAAISGRWGGRSLRAGFITTAAELDIPIETIAKQSGHRTLDSLIRYIRDDPFRRNPASKVGL